MFIFFDMLFMVNSNQRKGVNVAANCILCNANNCACEEGGTCFAITANNFYIILENFFNSPTVLALTNLIPSAHITLSCKTGNASNMGN